MALEPIRNLRAVDPRCCETCAFLHYDGNGMVICLRPNGPEWDASEHLGLYHVCSMWRSQRDNRLSEDVIARFVTERESTRG